MLQRTSHLFIGKDISRDAHLCADGASIVAFSKTTGIEDGEILVLDKQKKILAAGATNLDTDVIYICQGTSETYSFTDEAGTTVSSVRKVKVSDPIEGKKLKNITANAYTAKAERTAACNLTGLTPVVATEYFIRIIYKDMVEHPGQFTQTYRVVATDATLKTLVDAFTAKINAHKGRRVTSTDNDATITLTGLPIPECTSGLTDLDAFDMVNFEAKFLYVTSTGNWATMPSTSTTVTYTGPTFGSGTWEQVRDLEKAAWGYLGITNVPKWYSKLPAQETVKSATYNLIVIESDKSYLSPDNQYIKQGPLTTVIAFVVPTTGNQQANVLARLNPWIESFGFDSISL